MHSQRLGCTWRGDQRQRWRPSLHVVHLLSLQSTGSCVLPKCSGTEVMLTCWTLNAITPVGLASLSLARQQHVHGAQAEFAAGAMLVFDCNGSAQVQRV